MAAKKVMFPNIPDHHRYQRPEPLMTPRNVRKSLMSLIVDGPYPRRVVWVSAAGLSGGPGSGRCRLRAACSLVALFELIPGGTVADIRCDTGRDLPAIAAAGWTVTGLGDEPGSTRDTTVAAVIADSAGSPQSSTS